MFASHIQDYIMNYFPYKNNSKNNWITKYTNLTKLQKLLKANAGSVTSDLGGRAHGYLRTEISPDDYAKLSQKPYDKPTHPGLPKIPSSTEHH